MPWGLVFDIYLSPTICEFPVRGSDVYGHVTQPRGQATVESRNLSFTEGSGPGGGLTRATECFVD